MVRVLMLFKKYQNKKRKKEEETEGLSGTSRGSSSMRDFLALFCDKK